MMQKDTDIIGDLLLTADLYEDESDEAELGQGTSLSLLCIRAVGEIRKLRAQIEAEPAVAAGLPAIGPYRDFIPAPAVPADEQIHAAYREALGQSIRERDMPEIRKFARALLQSSQSAPAVAVPAVPNALQMEREWLEGWLHCMAEPMGQTCCGRSMFECCGSPDPVYPDLSYISASMSKRRTEIIAMLQSAPQLLEKQND